MQDVKTKNVILGIQKVIEDLEGLIKEQKEVQIKKQGVIAALQASQHRLAAETKKLGDAAKELNDKEKLSEDDKLKIKGKLQGYSECIEILKAMEKENSADFQQIKGRIAGYSELVQRSKKRIKEEEGKVERRKRMAEQDPDGTREDGSPKPLNDKPKKEVRPKQKKKKKSPRKKKNG